MVDYNSMNRNFETFDPKSMYPYDVPDALHIWSHQIITRLIHKITESTNTRTSSLSTLLDSTDLLSLAQDGRAVGAILSYYFARDCDIGGIHIDSHLNRNQIVTNWLKIQKWTKKINSNSPSWCGESFADWEGSQCEAFRSLITVYFADLYKEIVLREK